ncbi:MAG: aminotransferase class III-fold pyridoxal phosphate-dependent enzyme [Paracoccaceae bacterium]
MILWLRWCAARRRDHRRRGALGFGRLGSHFWLSAWGFTPDIVTMGKPMANGHPVAAVVALVETMRTFRSRSGIPTPSAATSVSCAAAMATLHVVQDEGCRPKPPMWAPMLLRACANWRRGTPARAMQSGAGLFFGAEMARTATARTRDRFRESRREQDAPARGFAELPWQALQRAEDAPADASSGWR